MKTCTLALAIITSIAAPWAAAQTAQPVDPVVEQSTQTGDPVPQDTTAPASPADPFFLFHLTGYADANFVNAQGDAGSSGSVTLAPIFHLLIGDRVFVEAELESTANDHGTTETGWEYAAVNVLLNDNAALVVGKFLSPVGNFFPNQHPSWINKMAAAPPGFGHGGAAPASDVGVQLRGGKTFANGQHINYAVYTGNGPRLGLEGMADLDLNTNGNIRNPDGKRVTGGRLGWMPIPTLELGASRARGNVVLDPGTGLGPEPSRSYGVDGFDAAWRPTKSLDLRGEWIRQRVGEAPTSMVADKGLWRAWFLQGAYRFGSEKWEAVLRHGDSVSTHAEATLKQTAIGINYLGLHHAVIKLDWEFNDSADAGANADRLLLQFAYAL